MPILEKSHSGPTLTQAILQHEWQPLFSQSTPFKLPITSPLLLYFSPLTKGQEGSFWGGRILHISGLYCIPFNTVSLHCPSSLSLYAADQYGHERRKCCFHHPTWETYVWTQGYQNVYFTECCMGRESQSCTCYMLLWKLTYTFTGIADSKKVEQLSQVYCYFMNNGEALRTSSSQTSLPPYTLHDLTTYCWCLYLNKDLFQQWMSPRSTEHTHPLIRTWPSH